MLDFFVYLPYFMRTEADIGDVGVVVAAVRVIEGIDYVSTLPYNRICDYNYQIKKYSP